MDYDKKLALIFITIGIAAGIASTYVSANVASSMAVAIYLVSLILAQRFIKTKEKFSWLLTNTLVTFGLVWLVTWILLTNL